MIISLPKNKKEIMKDIIPACFFLSRDKTEKVEDSPDGKVIKFPPYNNANLS